MPLSWPKGITSRPQWFVVAGWMHHTLQVPQAVLGVRLCSGDVKKRGL